MVASNFGMTDLQRQSIAQGQYLERCVEGRERSGELGLLFTLGCDGVVQWCEYGVKCLGIEIHKAVGLG